jgi:alpha-galactosidase
MGRRTPVALLALAAAACALDNGFRLPAMGYSSWNDCSSFRDNGPSGWCWDAEQHIRDVTAYMISSGLARLGFVNINVDEGWLAGRNATTGQMYEDLSKFPSGMKALGTWIRSQPTFAGSNDTMRYGLYSCRGTCQCSTGTYSAPGSNGHEADDTEWMVAAGAQVCVCSSTCPPIVTHSQLGAVFWLRARHSSPCVHASALLARLPPARARSRSTSRSTRAAATRTTR